MGYLVTSKFRKAKLRFLGEFGVSGSKLVLTILVDDFLGFVID